MSNSPNAALIRSIAEPLRGDYKQSDYGKVILPFTLLRRKNLAYDISSAAVTGKIGVREALTPNPSPVATGEGS